MKPKNVMEKGGHSCKSQIKMPPRTYFTTLILYVLKEKKKRRRPQQMVKNFLSFLIIKPGEQKMQNKTDTYILKGGISRERGVGNL